MYEYRATVKEVIDGDTLYAIVDLGFGVFAYQSFRFARIDAYEARLGKNTTQAEKEIGLEAKAYVKDLIEGKEILIKSQKTGKYGRYIAEIIYTDENGNDVNLNDELVMKKYAVYKEY